MTIPAWKWLEWAEYYEQQAKLVDKELADLMLEGAAQCYANAAKADQRSEL